MNCFSFCALLCVLFDVILFLNSAADTFLLIGFTQFKISEIVCTTLLLLVCKNNLVLDAIITEKQNYFDEKLSK